MRLFKTGKLYQPTSNSVFISFDNYDTIKGWTDGYAVLGPRTEIRGPFMVLKSFGNYYLKVLYEEKILWIEAPYVNCEQIGDVE